MREENKIKLGEQLIRCVLDDKLSTDKKLRKMDYIIKMGGDINYNDENGFSVLILAKMAGNEEVVQFLMEKGVKDISIDNKKVEQFFKRASVEKINKFLNVLPDGYELDCDVDLSERGLTELPDFSKVVVNGNFNCSDNQLMTLNGAPSKVRGSFYCFCNYLTTLKWAPREVDKSFICKNNLLECLTGAPNKIRGNFDCDHNQLTSLEGAPTIIYGNFNCSNNRLITLKGAPREVDKSFICKNNLLECLTGAPMRIGGDFFCNNNPLKDMKGMPEDIRGEFFHRSDVMFMKKGNGRIDS